MPALACGVGLGQKAPLRGYCEALRSKRFFLQGPWRYYGLLYTSLPWNQKGECFTLGREVAREGREAPASRQCGSEASALHKHEERDTPASQ